MDSTGEILRRARNERRLTLDDVATRTRINRKYLAAIESGDHASIPGGFFYKSFVRQYAAALSTDESNVLEEVEQSLAAEHPETAPKPADEEVLKALATRAEENSPPASARSAAMYALLLVLVIAGTSGIYILWHRAQQAQAANEGNRPAAQAKKEEPPPASTQPVSPPPVSPTPAPVEPAPSEPQTPTATTPPATAQPEQNPPAPTQAPATATPESAPATSTPGPDDKIAVTMSATEPTWVSFAADGKMLFKGILTAGQSRVFAAKENARMRVGNAGGLNVVFNGKPTGPLGLGGQVTTLLFTPAGFEVEKPKNPDEPPPQN